MVPGYDCGSFHQPGRDQADPGGFDKVRVNHLDLVPLNDFADQTDSFNIFAASAAPQAVDGYAPFPQFCRKSPFASQRNHGEFDGTAVTVIDEILQIVV
jgi:hypothetical protein